MFRVLRSGLLPYKLHTCPKLWCNPCSKCYAVGCFGAYFTHVQSCDVTRVQSATRWTASGTYFTHVPKLWCNSCSKCYAVGCFGAYFTHVQSYDVTPCSKCYGMGCFGAFFTHVQSCDVTRVQSAMEWTASVHTSRMSKAVIKCYAVGLLRKILHTCPKLWLHPCSKCYAVGCFRAYFTHCYAGGLLRYRLHTCPKLWCNPCSKCYGMGCLAAYFTHVQSCDVTRVQSATQWTASVQTSHQDVMQYRGRFFTGRHVTSGRHMQELPWTRSVTSRHVTYTSGR